MAQKDYVKRGHAVSYKNKNKIKKILTIILMKNKIIIITIIILIGLFFYFKQHKNIHVNNKILSTNKIQSIPILPPKLPPKPKERWSYIKELKNENINISNINTLSTVKKY